MNQRLSLMTAVLAIAVPFGAVTGRPSAPVSRQDGDEPAVVLNAEVVLVNVVVTRDNGFVGGLTASDFRLTEDKVGQTIDYFGAEKTPFAVTILLDTSGSMEFKFRIARVAAARFMDRASADDRVAVILFGSDVIQAQDFTAGGRDLNDSLWDVSAKGITKMYDGLSKAAVGLAARPEQRRAVLLLSDGADFGSAVSYDAALRTILGAGATVYAIDLAPIGQTQALTRSEEMRARSVLSALATRTGGRFFPMKSDGSGLNEAFDQIIDELGHQYTLGYAPTNVKRDGTWRSISVTTAIPGAKVRARNGYQAPSQ